jgi:hypothetical protein
LGHAVSVARELGVEHAAEAVLAAELGLAVSKQVQIQPLMAHLSAHPRPTHQSLCHRPPPSDLISHRILRDFLAISSVFAGWARATVGFS